MTEVGALPSRVFEQDHGGAGGTVAKQLLQAVGNQLQPLLLAAAGVRARVHDETVESEPVGAIELLAEARRATAGAAAATRRQC